VGAVFFSWIIHLLWNSILVDQLALVAIKVYYWQAAVLWFLSIILFAWAGVAVSPCMARKWRKFDEPGGAQKKKPCGTSRRSRQSREG